MEGNEQQLTRHREIRENFYQDHTPFWHNLHGEPYALYDIFEMTQEELAEIRKAAEEIISIYDKTAQLLRNIDDEILVELGYPKETIPFIREKTLPIEGVIRRLDMVKTENGYKHIELNADTPTFIMECHYINGFVADEFGFIDPNSYGMTQLQKAIRKSISLLTDKIENPKIVFTAHSDHDEDWFTTCFLAEMYGELCEVVPLSSLEVVEGVGLFTPTGEKIDLLYRQTYPVEHLIHDKDEQTNTFVGIELLKLVQEKKLQLLNPLSSFLLQSKGVQALIWGLYEEKSEYFTPSEQNIIKKHFLPTYLDDEVFIKAHEQYVQKPCFGREGDSILLYNENGEVFESNKQQNYRNDPVVYQKLIELPKRTVQTPKGEENLHLLFGVFVIGSKAGAIGIRAGNKITGNESYFLPIGVK